MKIEPVKKMFLGGTCAGPKWRDQFIPTVKCKCYNPIVPNCSESDRLREVYERETSDIILYTITNGMKGVYSIAEIVDDSNKRPKKSIFCNLYRDDGTPETIQMSISIKATEELLKANGVLCFDNLKDVSDYVNSIC
jgi:hypothetical protein